MPFIHIKSLPFTKSFAVGAVASSLAERTGIPRDNIFIDHRQARSGMVFDAGSVEHWQT
jgi:hypothetical protein